MPAMPDFGMKEVDAIELQDSIKGLLRMIYATYGVPSKVADWKSVFVPPEQGGHRSLLGEINFDLLELSNSTGPSALPFHQVREISVKFFQSCVGVYSELCLKQLPDWLKSVSEKVDIKGVPTKVGCNFTNSTNGTNPGDCFADFPSTPGGPGTSGADSGSDMVAISMLGAALFTFMAASVMANYKAAGVSDNVLSKNLFCLGLTFPSSDNGSRVGLNIMPLFALICCIYFAMETPGLIAPAVVAGLYVLAQIGFAIKGGTFGVFLATPQVGDAGRLGKMDRYCGLFVEFKEGVAQEVEDEDTLLLRNGTAPVPSIGGSTTEA